MAQFFTGWGPFNTGFGVAGASAPDAPTANQSVVLFPVEPLIFRKRWDKTAYAWAVFSRDMRVPQGGYRPNTDHFVSVSQAMARMDP